MVYTGNYKELVNEISKHEKVNISTYLVSQRKKKQLWKKQDKITRYMHNYLASSFSLLHITSNYYRSIFKPENKLSEYDSKIKNEINSNPIKHFINDFRHFMQKYRVPHIFSTTSHNIDSSFETFVHYKTEDLQQFTGWNSKSKKYLKDHPEGVRLKEIVKEYHNLIEKFNIWFINAAESELKSDTKVIEKIEKQIKLEKFRQYIYVILHKDEEINKEQFEKSLSLYITKNEMQRVDNQTSNKDRVEVIISLLLKYKVVSELQIDLIRNIYK